MREGDGLHLHQLLWVLANLNLTLLLDLTIYLSKLKHGQLLSKKNNIQSLRVRSSSVKELDTFYLFLIKSKTTWISQEKLYDSRNTTRWFWPTDFSSTVWWYAEIANCVHQLCCRHNPLQKVDVKQSKIWLTGYWNRLWPLITPASSLLPGQLVKRKPSQLKRLWDKVGCFGRN